MVRRLIAGALLVGIIAAGDFSGAADRLTVDELRSFMHQMAQYIEKHHLKKDPDSPQSGMVYEYVDTTRLGRPGQWMQGEALDTMHDGAWYAAAMVDAFRATGDPYGRDFLEQYQVPFYAKVLNQSDTLFQDGLDANKVAASKNVFQKSHKYMGEKGFCPYFWDDGSSVSLEAHLRRAGQHPYMCVDYDLLKGQANPEFRLNGFSLGCSNHMAQDLAVMLMQTWLLTREERIAEAAMNLHQSRLLHHGAIPMVAAAAALCNGDKELMARVPAYTRFEPTNDYARALCSYEPGQTCHVPAFTDGQEYTYYHTIAHDGGRLNRAMAMKLIYDAFTLPMLIRYWSDNGQTVPAGMNRSEGAQITIVDGKPTAYRSDRDLSMGSRMGPQNLVLCAWALQALREYPGLWEQRYHDQFAQDVLVRFLDEAPQIDGKPHAGYSRSIEAGDCQLGIASDRHNLYLTGSTPAEAVAVTVFSQPDAGGRHAVLQLENSGKSQATNGEGTRLLHEAKIVPRDEGFDFEIRLPYTVLKPQPPWATGIEHGRYSVRVGQVTRNFYLLSTEQQVKDSLRRELVGGLANWRAVFRDKGFIPVAIGANVWRLGDTRVDQISDSGGYAHLIKAAAQYLLYQQGKSDWAVKEIPTP